SLRLYGANALVGKNLPIPFCSRSLDFPSSAIGLQLSYAACKVLTELPSRVAIEGGSEKRCVGFLDFNENGESRLRLRALEEISLFRSLARDGLAAVMGLRLDRPENLVPEAVAENPRV